MKYHLACIFLNSYCLSLNSVLGCSICHSPNMRDLFLVRRILIYYLIYAFKTGKEGGRRNILP